MHHELFFALLGHAGDVIEARADGFFVRADVSFLSPPQRVEIDRLLRLGHAFAVLDRFVASARQLPSLYVRGLAQGVEAILCEYTDAIVQLEAKVLTTRVVFPLPQMVYELEEFAELLPELVKLIAVVQTDAGPSATQRVLRGADLLALVHGMAESGFPRLRKRMSDLLRRCHSILFRQIVSWMAYGDIVDPYNEFFVAKLVQDDGVAGAAADEASESVESQIWQSRYGLEASNAPPYFPSQVVESIFFIGRSVQILAHSKGFSSEEAARLIQTFAKVQTPEDEFNRATLEHVVEEIRAQIAKRLYQEIVVKSEFVDHFKLLKEVFLLARGELFQSLMDQTSSSLMATKPTHKSEEELHHGVWSQILRDFQVDENPLLRRFRLELPLQTFRFPPFPDATGLLLHNMVYRDRYLEADNHSPSCGGAWWPHRQVEHLPFTSTILVDLSPTRSDPLAPWSGGKVALLITKDASFPAPQVASGAAHVTLLSSRTSLDLVSLELDVQPMNSDGSSVAVVAHVVVQSPGHDTDVQTSSAVVVPLDNNTLAVHIQYTRMEVREPATGKVASPRTITLVVNGNKVLQVECDLTGVLGSGTLTNDHYVGLCVTPRIRAVEWRLDKYASRAIVAPDRLLSESHESLSARELWNYLAMRCDLQWPMHLLVPKGLLRSYGHLFQFSLRLKRVAHALERTWKFRLFRPTRKPKSAVQSEAKDDAEMALRAAAALRSRMSFVVRNIEQYFQVFVVESSFAKCLEAMDAAQDLDKVKRLHEQFIAQLVRRFYLHTHTMQGAIDQVLRCCWEFAEYAAYQENGLGGGGALRADRVADLEQQFTERFGLLFRTLRHPSSRDLLLLLDYNGFFSRAHADPYTDASDSTLA